MARSTGGVSEMMSRAMGPTPMQKVSRRRRGGGAPGEVPGAAIPHSRDVPRSGVKVPRWSYGLVKLPSGVATVTSPSTR